MQKFLVRSLFLVLLLSAAADFQKAINIRDYATALKELTPLAEQGDVA